MEKIVAVSGLIETYNSHRDAVEMAMRAQDQLAPTLLAALIEKYGISRGMLVENLIGNSRERGRIIRVDKIELARPSDYSFRVRLYEEDGLLRVSGKYRLVSGEWSQKPFSSRRWRIIDDQAEKQALEASVKKKAEKALKLAADALGVDVSDILAKSQTPNPEA